jgi:hypothetical protein
VSLEVATPAVSSVGKGATLETAVFVFGPLGSGA